LGKSENGMRIAAFNIEDLAEDGDVRDSTFCSRAAVLLQALKRLNADILCAQEVLGQELAAEFLPTTGHTTIMTTLHQKG